MQKYPRSHTSALDAANFLLTLAAQEGRPMDPLTLQKVLFYAQCWSLAEGRRLFDDDIEAWKHGPVASIVWKAYSGSRPIDVRESLYYELDSDQTDLLRSVWNALRHLTGFQLSEMSHRDGGAWSNARRGLPDAAPSRHVLKLNDMATEANTIRQQVEADMIRCWDDIVGTEV